VETTNRLGALAAAAGEELAGTAQLLPCDILPSIYSVRRLLPDG
jgi:hypothetical protein